MAQTLVWIIQNIMHEAPLMGDHLEAQERVSNPSLTFLRKLALVVAEQNLLNNELLASHLYEICESAEIIIPGLHEPDEEKGRRMIGSIMARVFKNGDSAKVDEFNVTKRNKPTEHHVLKTYWFDKESEA